MPIIRRQDIAPAVKEKHDAAHKTQLRQALTNPALTEQQRAHIREQLSGMGQARVYSKNSPAKPGAIAFTNQSSETEGEPA